MDGLADRKYTLWIALLITVFFIQILPYVAYAQPTSTLSTTRGVRRTTTYRSSVKTFISSQSTKSTTTITKTSANVTALSKDCGDPIKPNNGDVSFKLTTVNSTARYFCNEGYDLQGRHNTTCLENGTWDHVLPNCEPKDCGNPRTITNGNVEIFQTTVYAAAIYSCYVGYELKGREYIICLQNGTWEQLLPDCILKDCGQPRNITNGDVSYSVTTVNSTASYSCHMGYDIQGQHNITCSENRKWGNVLPGCIIKVATSLLKSEVASAIRNVVNYTESGPPEVYEAIQMYHGQIVSAIQYGVEFAELPFLIHGIVVSRFARGRTCIKDCGAPRHVFNGDVSCNETTVNSTAIYSCHVGYELHGQDNITCLENGKWENVLQYCILKDCGLPPKLDNAGYRLIGNTTVSSIALYSCNSGYQINGTVNSLKCEKSGNWTDRIIHCVSIACPMLNPPDNGYINQTTKYAVFTCKDGYTIRGWKTLFCDDNGKWSGKDPTCVKPPAEVIEDCKNETDSRNTVWDRTPPGQTASKHCSDGLKGSISRNCTPNGVWKRPTYSCVNKAVSQAGKVIEAIESNNASDEVKSEAITDVLGTLSNSTKSQVTTSKGAPIYDGEIEKVTSILERIANISQNIVVTISQTEDFIGTTSNLLNPQNSESYKSLEENQEEQKDKNAAGAEKVLQVIGNFVKAVAKSLHAGGKRTIKKDNMLMTVSHMKEKEDIHFPEDLNRNTSVYISNNVLKDVESFSGILYHNLSGLLPTTLSENGIDNHNTFQINAAVMDMQLVNKQNKTTSPDFKINLSFDNFQKGAFGSKCSFWNFNKRSWDIFGCHLDTDHSDSRFTTCICNHTTNFAILINPLSTPNVDSKALDYISIIGCSISFISLMVTVVIHGLLWRYLKSDRAKILINLCVALILSYALFVGGVDRTENKIACTVVAIALHYIYLVVFFLMLSEGIEILMKVVFVFVMKSVLRYLLPLSWGLPIVIVGVSVGATRTEGYGSEYFCWLSVHGGLIWAFVGPALLVIVANLILLSIVMKAMFRVQTLKDKERVEKVKTGVRCLCVLLPLTGGTWVIGVFYVNESMAWIQYVFALLNSLQGLFIVLFHCILNTQVRKAISKRRKGCQSNTHPMTKPNSPSTDGNHMDLSESAIDTYLESTDIEKKYDDSRETENEPRQKSFAYSIRL